MIKLNKKDLILFTLFNITDVRTLSFCQSCLRLQLSSCRWCESQYVHAADNPSDILDSSLHPGVNGGVYQLTFRKTRHVLFSFASCLAVSVRYNCFTSPVHCK